MEPGEAVLDVACGPGTLSRLAARVTGVHGLDFSKQMLAEAWGRASDDERQNLTFTTGDGQALPFADASFDVGFSMFGLFMFPDRARGFAELHRVLRPGGRALVATWQPQDGIPPFVIINRALAEELKDPQEHPPPLSDPRELRREMEAAGFEVEVHPATHTLSSPSLDTLWEGLERAHVALGIARTQLGAERYRALVERIRARLTEQLPVGEQQLVMPAWLGLGKKPV
ncbi:MAG: methyltransferase domain-containing protein [Myxococcota bacterium]